MRMVKKYETRSGKPITLLSTCGRGVYCNIGYIGGGNTVYSWDDAGRNRSATLFDAIEVAEPLYLYFRMDGGEVRCSAPIPSEDLDRIHQSEHTLRVNLRHPFDTKVMTPLSI